MKHRNHRTGKFQKKPSISERMVAPILLIFTVTVSLTTHLGRANAKTAPINPVSVQEEGVANNAELGRTAIAESTTTPSPTPEPTSLPTPEPKIAKITAYSCEGIKNEAERLMNCPNGITADGTKPVAYKTMACDRANLGRTFWIEGIGEVKCTDTGGAIKGPGRFDLYVHNIDTAYDWGVQQREYILIEE